MQSRRNTGNRLRQQLVDAVTGEAVDSSDKGRGYEVGDSSFLPVEDEELELARQQAQARRPGATVQPPAPSPSARHLYESLTARADAPPRPCLLPHLSLPGLSSRTRARSTLSGSFRYIAPRDAVGQEAFAVIRDALERKQLLGIGRVILQSRDRP